MTYAAAELGSNWKQLLRTGLYDFDLAKGPMYHFTAPQFVYSVVVEINRYGRTRAPGAHQPISIRANETHLSHSEQIVLAHVHGSACGLPLQKWRNGENGALEVRYETASC